MPVYFCRLGNIEAVKIGWAANVERRVAEMQAAHYADLKVIRELPGGRTEGAWLHRRFREHLIAREWFKFVPEMLTVEVPALEQPTPTSVIPDHMWPVVRAAGVNFGASTFQLQKWRERGVPWKHVMRVLDALEQAGIDAVPEQLRGAA